MPGGGEGYGGGLGGSSRAGMTPGNVTQDAQVDPNMIDVELYGIEIYNPVNMGQLDVAAQGGA